jgi:stage II sporulation protein AA (anti-sigma F factor antagonist)
MGKTMQLTLDGIVVVELQGKLDTGTADPTERLLLERTAGARQVVLDLSAVPYVSSAGLRVLLVVAKRLRAVEGRLILCGVQPYVKEVLDISGLSSIFPIFASRTEALSAAQEAR